MSEYRYSGVGRLGCVVQSIALPTFVVAAFYSNLFLTFKGFFDRLITDLGLWLNGIVAGANIAIYLVIIIVAVKRLHNLGMSGWWVLLQYVPVINLWLFWLMLACPEGYDDHKELDRAGKIITACLLLFVILPIIAIVVLNLTSGVKE